MRTTAQNSSFSRPGSGVAKQQNTNPGREKPPGNKGFVRGVRGLGWFYNRNVENMTNSNSISHNTYFFGFNPGHPGLEAKNKGFFSSPGLQNSEMQPRTPDSIERGGWRHCIRGWIASFKPHFAGIAVSLAGFVFAILTTGRRAVSSMNSIRKDNAMIKAKRRGGRPPLSKSEKSVPTVIRLLPSVRKAIKSEADRKDVSVSELLRDIVEGRVVQMVREDDSPRAWSEQEIRSVLIRKPEQMVQQLRRKA